MLRLSACLLVPLALLLGSPRPTSAQGTRLLRQPTMSATQVGFIYGGDPKRLTWYPAGGASTLLPAPSALFEAFEAPRGRAIARAFGESGAR